MEDTTNWLKLCSSLDVVEDTQLAIESFHSDALGEELIDGFGYLQIYGLLQSLFLQQDAARNIATSLSIEFNLTPELRRIRELRNDTTGHPTDRNRGKYFCFVVRSSIYDGKFTYYKDRPKGDRFNEVHVNIRELIDIQYNEISNSLGNIIKEIRNREQIHRDQFKGEKMIEIFPNVLNWYFSKLNEAISNPMLHKLGALHVSEIKKVLVDLEKELKKRNELNGSDWFYDLSEDIEYPLSQLSFFFDSDENCEINGITASIFVFFVRHKFEEMKSIVKEIDDDYESPI